MSIGPEFNLRSSMFTVSDFAYQDMEMEDIGVEDLDDLFD